MRLSWQEIRNRALEFSEQWKDAYYEMGETQGFYIDFFKVFGIDHRRVLRFEEKVNLIQQEKRGRIDGFWPGMLLIEQKSAGRDLAKAKTQAFDYFDGLRDRDLPKYVLTSDFQNFELHDLAPDGETFRFKLADLYKNVDLFGFMLGVERRHYGDQDKVSIDAAELLGKIHDALEEKNYKGIDLQRLMVRLLFLLFADDTGIFEDKDDFRFLIEENSDEDGRNIGRILNELFEVLDTPDDERVADMAADFAKFPYVNGELFSGSVKTAPFDARLRDDLLECCAFDWGAVSPAIFGSLFQSVMDREERRKKGAHYTTEPNIMKVIGPLFLDELRAEFQKLKSDRGTAKRSKLLAFQEKLGSLNFIDPACGCGNFLVVTYRELRRLEQEVLKEVYLGQRELFTIETLSMVKLDQFYGIELEEFPAHIAEVAMWMTEHLANIELGRAFGEVFSDIPLHDGAAIHHGDALEVDWNDVLPHEECFAVMGNPPFIGHQWRDKGQQAGMHRVWGRSGQFNRLDFVTAWFKKAVDYAKPKKQLRIAFVATNSISQGEQAGILWSYLFGEGVFIRFAHRTFAWGSDARGKAAVHCVIIGMQFYPPVDARLFDYETVNGEATEFKVESINGYLIDGPRLAVPARTKAPHGLPAMFKGSQPTDGARIKTPDGYLKRSNLILDQEERRATLKRAPEVEKWLRPYVGGEELISGDWRWCLWLREASPKELRSSDEIADRLARVKEGRLQSPTKTVRDYAAFPTLFTQDRQPNSEFIAVPEVSSERREYVPIGLLSPDIIASNKLQIVPLGSRYHFGILTSAAFNQWLRTVGGRLKSDLSLSPTVYNTFPWPEASQAQRAEIEKLVQAVLDARDAYPDSSLADLYDPDTMPPDLRRAHKALDKAVDRLYRKKPFDSDRERVEHLFRLYEKLVNPMSDADRQNKRVDRNKTRRETSE